MAKPSVPRTCLVCAAPFLATRNQVKRGGGKYCSHRCEVRSRTTDFWDHVDKAGPMPAHRPELGECHLWTGSKSNADGYGSFRFQGKPRAAHRIAFFLAHGRWPDPCALHHCDNPSCVRLEHLFEGTKLDNARDRDAKRRRVVPRGERNWSAKLLDAEVAAIRLALVGGSTVGELAARYAVSEPLIYAIRSGHRRAG